MRVIAGKHVAIGMLNVGTVVEDADERQGYFWMNRRKTMFGPPQPTKNDICVPLEAICKVDCAGGFFENYSLGIIKQDLASLPLRWQVQPRGTLIERVKQQSMERAGGVLFPPALGMPVFADQSSGAAFPRPTTPTGLHPIAQMGDQTLARMREAKRRHTERCQGAAPDEMEFLDRMLTDEIEAIKAEYDRARSHLRTEEAI